MTIEVRSGDLLNISPKELRCCSSTRTRADKPLAKCLTPSSDTPFLGQQIHFPYKTRRSGPPQDHILDEANPAPMPDVTLNIILPITSDLRCSSLPLGQPTKPHRNLLYLQNHIKIQKVYLCASETLIIQNVPCSPERYRDLGTR